jgi:16S rRNA (cytosine967-C5)-methyltransferase
MLVLNRVLIDEAYASLTLDEMFQKMQLCQRDKRLAAAIVYKTLENITWLDFALDEFLRDRSALDKRVVNVLRLSACQILLMDRVPDFAVVNEAVDLVRTLGLEDLTGLVNGVLRSLIRGMDSLPWPKPEDDNYLSVTHSLPQWLVEAILSAYPEETAHAIMGYRNPDHAITLRRNEVLLSQDEFEKLLSKKVWNVKPGKLEGVVRVSSASDIGQDTDFLGGRFSIQGEGSMLAALAVAPKVGAQMLDCCAAPGGKTCFLAEKMQNTGRIHAWDVHEHRVELIKAQAERLRLYNIRPAVRDASMYQERFEKSMDAVLLDAPCSGTGVMDNKPDIKHRLTSEGLEAMSALQETLLNTNSRYVKPGGVLIYSTCSILPQENQQQIERFLASHPDFSLDRLPEGVPEQYRELSGPYGLQLLPHRDGMEGFFIARLKRI